MYCFWVVFVSNIISNQICDLVSINRIPPIFSDDWKSRENSRFALREASRDERPNKWAVFVFRKLRNPSFVRSLVRSNAKVKQKKEKIEFLLFVRQCQNRVSRFWIIIPKREILISISKAAESFCLKEWRLLSPKDKIGLLKTKEHF